MKKDKSHRIREYSEVAWELLKLLFDILRLVVLVAGMIILFGGFLK